MEAFLDSAPDPFRARQPSVNKARTLVCLLATRGIRSQFWPQLWSWSSHAVCTIMHCFWSPVTWTMCGAMSA